MDKLKVSLSFRRQYKHIYEHLLTKPNRSDYVCRLIEANMNKKGQLSEEEIRKVVMKVLGKQEVGLMDIGIRDNSPLDESDVDLINQLF